MEAAAESSKNTETMAASKAEQMDLSSNDPGASEKFTRLVDETLNQLNTMDPKAFREMISKTMNADEKKDKANNGLKDKVDVDIKAAALNDKGEITALEFNNPYSKDPNDRIVIEKGTVVKPGGQKSARTAGLAEEDAKDNPNDGYFTQAYKIGLRQWHPDEYKKYLNAERIQNDTKPASERKAAPPSSVNSTSWFWPFN